LSCQGGGTMAKKTILIADDNDELRSFLRKALIANNHNVIEASDGAEALETVENNPPDLIVLDLVLPKVSGETVCTKIKSTHPNIIIIALTAKSNTDDIVRGLQIGADDYVTKPFVKEELIARIEAKLKSSTKEEGYQ